jgi:hypothetical protein
MGDEIKVDPQEFKEQASLLGNALSAFEPFIGYFQRERELLSGNSDFLTKYLELIDNMSDDANPDLLARIADYAQKADMLGFIFGAVDEQIGDGFHGVG